MWRGLEGVSGEDWNADEDADAQASGRRAAVKPTA
jgi:hypothetical protein